MLFSIVDTIGSFYEKDKGFTIIIEGKDKTIKTDEYQHFFILNSDYYNQKLKENQIKKIYQNFRNKLMHNSSLPPNQILKIGQDESQPFLFNEENTYI
ncbi:hypothetical protein GYA19_05055 [Candidatus Beckwithbacteria bacterium]|nr:hypothetical protein [Candidatus Beckwithbacteria bacterium]